MAEAAVDLLALADAVLARRSRVHASTDSEHMNTASHASGLIPQRPRLSDPSVNTARPIVGNYEERAAPAETRVGVPREWAEGFARLQVGRPPARLSSERWQLVIDDAERFIDRWAAQAAALGWRTLDVFGMHATKPEERLDAAGLIWCIGGADVLAITSYTARLQLRSGVTLSFRRNEAEHPEAAAIWTHELSGVPARAMGSK